MHTSRLFFARHVKQMLRRLVFSNDTQPGLASSAPTGSAGMSGISLIAAMMQSENMHNLGISRTRTAGWTGWPQRQCATAQECKQRWRPRILLEKHRHSLKSHLIIESQSKWLVMWSTSVSFTTSGACKYPFCATNSLKRELPSIFHTQSTPVMFFISTN